MVPYYVIKEDDFRDYWPLDSMLSSLAPVLAISRSVLWPFLPYVLFMGRIVKDPSTESQFYLGRIEIIREKWRKIQFIFTSLPNLVPLPSCSSCGEFWRWRWGRIVKDPDTESEFYLLGTEIIRQKWRKEQFNRPVLDPLFLLLHRASQNLKRGEGWAPGVIWSFSRLDDISWAHPIIMWLSLFTP